MLEGLKVVNVRPASVDSATEELPVYHTTLPPSAVVGSCGLAWAGGIPTSALRKKLSGSDAAEAIGRSAPLRLPLWRSAPSPACRPIVLIARNSPRGIGGPSPCSGSSFGGG